MRDPDDTPKYAYVALVALIAAVGAFVWWTTNPPSPSTNEPATTTSAPAAGIAEPDVPGGNVIAAASRAALESAAQATVRAIEASAALEQAGSLRDVDPTGDLAESSDIKASVSGSYRVTGEIEFTAANGDTLCLVVGDTAAASTTADGNC